MYLRVLTTKFGCNFGIFGVFYISIASVNDLTIIILGFALLAEWNARVWYTGWALCMYVYGRQTKFMIMLK